VLVYQSTLRAFAADLAWFREKSLRRPDVVGRGSSSRTCSNGERRVLGQVAALEELADGSMEGG
jgi:hypothetical protein